MEYKKYRLTAAEEDILTLLEEKVLCGAQITQAFLDVGGRRMGSALYAKLKDLTAKKLITIVETRPVQKFGHESTYFTLTALGIAVLRDTQLSRANLLHWQGK